MLFVFTNILVIIFLEMSINKNLVCNAEMGDEWLTHLIDQVQLGMHIDRGLEKEAYNNIALTFNASNKYLKNLIW